VYDDYSKADLEKAKDPFSRFNLDSESGRKAFEAEINRLIGLYPGAFVREGE